MIVNRGVFACSLFLMTWTALLWGNSLGPPADRSGVSGVTCSTSGCHNDLPANVGGGSVSITGLPAEWTPGVIYPLQVSVSHSGASLYGFQMTAVDSNGAQAGGFLIGTGTAIQSGSVGGKTIEHMQHSFASPNNTFSFSWTAPETSSTGAVKFNVAANAANGNFNQFGDFIYSTVETSVEGAALAPADAAAFDDLVVGQRMLSILPTYYVDFVAAGRFEQTQGVAISAGSYSYATTGPDTGTVVFNYDDGDSCTNSVTFVSRTNGRLSFTCNDGRIGETSWRLVDDPDYVPITPPGTGTGGSESFSIPDRGGRSTKSSGTAETLRVGYGRIRAEAGSSTPAGIAIFQFRDSEGVLISEAGVPAVESVHEGRIFAEVNGPVNTGLAIGNPNDVAATIRFYFTDTSGTRFGEDSFVLGAHQQRAEFLDQAPFNGGPSVLGTFTFTSSVPVAVVALRGFTNEAGEFLMTTLPVAPLSSTASDPVYFPHFADGSGWATQVVLVNPTDRTITGTVVFMGPGSDTAAASPAILTLDDGRTRSDFDYSIAPRSAQRFTTSNPPGGLAVGSVRATPSTGNAAPSGLVVFSFASGGKTVSEAGVPALPKGSAFRVYVESSGMPNQRGSIRSGLAIANTGATTNTVTLEVTRLDGSLAVPPETLELPPSGQIARFLDEIFSLRDNFSGVVRVTSTAEVAIVGLRLRVNQRGELKVTTTPPSNETGPSSTAERFFPHIVDSGGWSTQFILYSGTAGQASSGTLRFIDTAGEPWDLPTQSSVSEGVPPGGGAVADLVVQSPSVSDASPDLGESFTFSATVRNQGNARSAATTLRYYRSLDATISTGDTEVGTAAVSALAASSVSHESIDLTAPSTAGTYYYGACVDPVSGESNAGNNCSDSRAVEVRSASMAGIIPDANLRAAIEAALDKVSGAPITLAEMKTLDRLDAPDRGISDLTGLESAANLTSLDLGGNNITDLSALSGLTNLRDLTLWGNNLTDLSALSGLTTLRDLRLGGNTISDVSALSGLTNLTYLHLNGNPISDVSALSGLTELEGLEIFGAAISDISALSSLTNLQNLGLGHNNLTDFSVLSGLTNLTSLWLDNTAISDLSVLSSLTNLDFLSLWDNNLTDVSALSGLTNLTHLRLGANNLTDVSALSGLTNLELLYLGGNNLTNVSALSGLTNLRELSLWDNNLTDVSALSGLTNLRSLELANNNLTDVSPLRNLANLASLDLRGNPLNVSSVNDHIPALERSGATVHFDRLLTESDFDIELVFLDDHFTEKHKRTIRYAARRWMSIIREDLPDHTFANRWSGVCGDQSYAIPSGERIDDLRIYVIARHLVGGIAGQGGPSVLRTTGLPVIGCVEFDLESVTSESVSSLGSRNLALHEMGHVLGIGTIWDDFIQNPSGDPHFTGPLAIAAFNAAGGQDYAGAKVPVEHAILGHWRAPVLEGELMVGADGSGSALSAITIQALADLGWVVDVTQADAYTLPGTAAKASAKHAAAIPEADLLRGSLASPIHAEPKPWCGLDGEREPIYVVDQLGRIIRTIGN